MGKHRKLDAIIKRYAVVFGFGYGLTHSEIEENWIDENTVDVMNVGYYDTSYSVLKFEYIPHKSLCGVKKVFIKREEDVTVRFEK